MPRSVFPLLAMIFIQGAVAAPDAEVARLIAASQTGIQSLLFKAADPNVPLLEPSSYDHPQECEIRGGIPNALAKLKAGGPVTVVYLGGSITRAEGYRPLSAKWIQEQFPKALVLGINAGVSGTPTDLGALRVGEHVLAYKPDLVFVEFAVNGGTVDALDGIVRQIWKANPLTDICFLYTIIEIQAKGYAEGTLPKNVIDYDKVAAHYQIPAIHLAREVSEKCREGAVLFKGKSPDPNGKIVFSPDGVHPSDRVGALFYGDAIVRSLRKMEGKGKEGPHALLQSFSPDPWEDATMVDPSRLTASPGWKLLDSPSTPRMAPYKAWFPQVLSASAAGESLRFRFRGKGFGFFDIGAPEVGQFKIRVDGKDAEPVNRFGPFCNNRTRGQYHFISTEGGDHEVTLTIDETIPDKKAILGPNQQADITANPSKYDQRAIYLGRLLLRGVLLP